MVWEVDRENHEEPIRLTLGEAVVLLNRVGLTVEQARSERPVWEVEGLLMALLAQSELRRKEDEDPRTTVIKNPEGEPAPDWVGDLPEE